MPELMIDFITSLDGYGAAEGWPGWWGLEGPDYLAWLETSRRPSRGARPASPKTGPSRHRSPGSRSSRRERRGLPRACPRLRPGTRRRAVRHSRTGRRRLHRSRGVRSAQRSTCSPPVRLVRRFLRGCLCAAVRRVRPACSCRCGFPHFENGTGATRGYRGVRARSVSHGLVVPTGRRQAASARPA